jgi:hypothetical protein
MVSVLIFRFEKKSRIIFELLSPEHTISKFNPKSRELNNGKADPLQARSDPEGSRKLR